MSLELLSEEGYRMDGRKANELRRVRCNLGVFQQADGSAYIEQGNTKILAAVYGPHEPSQNFRSQVPHDDCLINCEYSQAAFSGVERKNRPRGDRKGQEMAAHIKQTFEASVQTTLYPRSQIDICLQVLQSDGSDYAVSVNAATLALIDAGITMKDYIIACSASLAKGVSLVDINHIEESVGCAELSAAVLPKLGRIVYTELNGKGQFQSCTELEVLRWKFVDGAKHDVRQRHIVSNHLISPTPTAVYLTRNKFAGLHEDEMGQILEAVEAGCQDVFHILEEHVREHVKDTAANFAVS